MSKTPSGIMIDIETLGVNPGAVILQIGAVEFYGPTIIRELNIYIDVQDSLDQGFTVEAGTLKWWYEQQKDSRLAVLQGQTKLVDALTRLNNFIENADTSRRLIWSNGPGFDTAILRAAYKKLGIDYNWKYYDELDMRTVRRVSDTHLRDFPKAEHNALSDAHRQVAILNAGYAQLFGAPTPALTPFEKLDIFRRAGDLQGGLNFIDSLSDDDKLSIALQILHEGIKSDGFSAILASIRSNGPSGPSGSSGRPFFG
jgi:DNA polymerase III epsilon subunit-like protein